MEAVVQRRLTPLLVTACITLGLVLSMLISGLGRQVNWKSAPAVRPLPAISNQGSGSVPPAQPLASMQDTWRHTLFEPSRKSWQPAKAAVVVTKLDGLALTGVVRTSSLQVALLQDVTGKALRIPLEATYQGWRLTSVEQRRVIFARGADHTELTLPDPEDKPALRTASGASVAAVSSVPPSAPLMTMESGGSTRSSPMPASMDDVAVRQARMDALKKIVSQRRQASPPSTGSP
jgi:hypothetical protein